MSKTIESVPDYLTREQYVGMFAALGFDPSEVIELRAAADGVHALVVAHDTDGTRIPDGRGRGYVKHRVFIPVRRPDGTDQRVARVTEVSAP